MAFELARQLQQEPAVREDPATMPWQMTPEQIYSTYGTDSSDSGAISRALEAARQSAYNGITFDAPNYYDTEGSGTPISTTVTPENFSSLWNERDNRDAMTAALQTANPELYGQYSSYNDRLMNELYPQSYQTYTANKTGMFGGQIDNFMDKYGKYIPMAVGAYMGGAALAPEAAGVAAGEEMLTAPTGAAFSELMSSPYMASIPAVEGGLGAAAGGGLLGAAKGAYDTVKPIYDKGKALVSGLLGGGQPTGGAPQGSVNITNKVPQNVPNIAPVNWMTPPPAQTPLARGMSGQDDLQQMMQAARKQYWG